MQPDPRVPPKVRMSDYGYWVVTYSLAPSVALSVMVCHTGISPQQAVSLATTTLAHTPARKGKS